MSAMVSAHETGDSRGAKRPRPASTISEQDQSQSQQPKQLRPNQDEMNDEASTPSRYPLRVSDYDRLFDLFTKRGAYWTIFDNIAARLPIGDLIALQRTCKATALVYQELLKTQWNVDMKLKRFFHNPTSFRAKLGEHSALITGRFVVAFFERVNWDNNQLVIVVREGENMDGMRQYICEAEGYTHIGISHESSKYNWFSRSESKIAVYAVKKSPVAQILKEDSLTYDMNFMTWNKAYAMIPQPTFLHHKAYICGRMKSSRRKKIATIKFKGWRIRPVLWPEEEDGIRDRWLGKHGRRRVGDELTWIISFPTLEVNRPKMPDSVVEYSEFRITKKEEVETANPNTFVSSYNIATDDFRSSILRFEYTGAEIMDRLGSRLDSLARFELLQLKRDERPAALMESERFGENTSWGPAPDEAYTFPSSWTYYDDELPEWYDMVERQLREGKVLGDIEI